MPIQDEPTLPGLYVAYINDQWLIQRADRKLLMWSNGEWSYPGSDQRYRGHVYGCIGPLPVLSLET